MTEDERRRQIRRVRKVILDGDGKSAGQLAAEIVDTLASEAAAR